MLEMKENLAPKQYKMYLKKTNFYLKYTTIVCFHLVDILIYATTTMFLVVEGWNAAYHDLHLNHFLG